MVCWFYYLFYWFYLNLFKRFYHWLHLFTLSNYLFFNIRSTKRITSNMNLFFFNLLYIIFNVFIIFIWLFLFHTWLQNSFLFEALKRFLIYFFGILKLLTISFFLKIIKWKSLFFWRLNALNCCNIVNNQITKRFFIRIIESRRLRNSPKYLRILLIRIKTLTKNFFIRKIIIVIFALIINKSFIRRPF